MSETLYSQYFIVGILALILVLIFIYRTYYEHKHRGRISVFSIIMSIALAVVSFDSLDSMRYVERVELDGSPELKTETIKVDNFFLNIEDKTLDVLVDNNGDGLRYQSYDLGKVVFINTEEKDTVVEETYEVKYIKKGKEKTKKYKELKEVRIKVSKDDSIKKQMSDFSK